MKKFWLLIFFYVLPAYSQPVVPNFVTGTMSSTTNTTTSITETITSKDYKTGYEYTVSGTGITNSGGMQLIRKDVYFYTIYFSSTDINDFHEKNESEKAW